MALFTNRLDWKGVLLGWIVGIVSGIYLVVLANPSGALSVSNTASPWGAIYIGVVSVALNIVVTVLGSLVASWTGTFRKGLIKESEFTSA